jgi:hypothetical protein
LFLGYIHVLAWLNVKSEEKANEVRVRMKGWERREVERAKKGRRIVRKK